MSQAIVANQKASFEHAYGLMRQFIEVCPEHIWVENFGGWPVWQQVYHALTSTQLMALREGEKPEPGLYPPEVAMLDKIPDKAPEKQEMLGYAARMKARIDGYISAMQDSDLPAVNQILTARMKAHGMRHAFSHSQTLTMLAGHILYHLGACDAALRKHGLKGVF